MSSGHSLKTRAEQERISSFLHENSRRSNSQESKSNRSSRNRHHRHPLDPVESDSDSDHRNRHRSNPKSKSHRRRSHSRSSGSDDDRRQRSKRHEKTNETSSRRHRRHSSSSSSRSSTNRKQKNSMEKHEPKLTSTIIMQNIPLIFDEHELLSELSIAKVPVQEIRMIHRRDPSTNLQTAYIEFNTVEEAEEWMTLTQGTFLLNDHPVTLKHRYDDESSSSINHPNNSNYSNSTTTHRDYSRNNINELRMRDWDCYKCGVQNFKRRDHCFNCHISREDSERSRDLDGYAFVGLNPCSTLVLRGLDILTTKETIEAKLIELTLVQMKNTAIVKDNYTGVSRGFAFVEYNSIHESVLVYEKVQTSTPGIEIDGKAVIVHFAKNNFATSLAQTQDEDEDFYTRRSGASRNRHRHEHDHDRSSNVAQLLPSNNVDRTNTAAEIAQQALQNIHAQKNRDFTRGQRRRNHSSDEYSSDSSSNQQSKKARSTKDNETYQTPDPSKFEWYPEVGYHFDKKTGFYFDAKSQYFYNPTTQKYMYWDPAQSTYVPIEETATTAAVAAAAASDATNFNTGVVESKEKVEKVKNAQQIAKEMEQWAKKERERKEKEAKRKAQVTTNSTTSTAVSTADSTAANSSTASGPAFADVGLPANRPAGGLISLNLMSSSSNTSTLNRPALLAAFEHPESDPEDNDNSNSAKSSTATTSTNILDDSEEKLVDWAKLTCLLCQRQFDTREILEKHLQMSNLHKENLAKAGIVRSQTLVYRDRAKERREKYGHDDTKKRKDYSPVHERSYSTSSHRMPPQHLPSAPSSSSSSSKSDSIGSKLMKKHGWQEGHGLGKKLQGRADPVQAETRQRGLGLGADKGLYYQAEPGESYKDVVRKVARARFSMLES